MHDTYISTLKVPYANARSVANARPVACKIVHIFSYYVFSLLYQNSLYRPNATMVLTTTQITAFFTNANQMALPAATVTKLAEEGILSPADLSEFDEKAMGQIADNLRRPGGRVVDPNDPNATIPTPPFVFGAKSQQRLNCACKAVRFYNMIGRTLSASNLRWDPVLFNFKGLWEAIIKQKEGDEPDTPKITKALPIMKWVESFTDHLHRCIGVRHVPLSYVIRPSKVVAAVCPPLKLDQPYSEENGSIEEDMVARASHASGLFKADNASVYYKIEEATRSTTYAASIAPYQKAKNGRAAFLALQAQYAGDDKWELELKKQDSILHSRKWKGQSNFCLEKYIQLHRNAFVSMQACTTHVAFQLPNEFTRVGYLLDGIECNDPQLQAAIANIYDDVGTTAAPGKRSNFEAASAYLLPKDPVTKRRNTAETGRANANIGSTTVVDGEGEESSRKRKFSKKKGTGSTGVALRYHKPDEYNKLTHEQRKELQEWRASKGTSKKARSSASISATVAKQVKEAMATIGKAHDEWRPPSDEQTGASKEAVKAFIMSAFQDAPDKPEKKATIADASASVPVPEEIVIPPRTPKITLASILKQAKNQK